MTVTTRIPPYATRPYPACNPTGRLISRMVRLQTNQTTRLKLTTKSSITIIPLSSNRPWKLECPKPHLSRRLVTGIFKFMNLKFSIGNSTNKTVRTFRSDFCNLNGTINFICNTQFGSRIRVGGSLPPRRPPKNGTVTIRGSKRLRSLTVSNFKNSHRFVRRPKRVFTRRHPTTLGRRRNCQGHRNGIRPLGTRPGPGRTASSCRHYPGITRNIANVNSRGFTIRDRTRPTLMMNRGGVSRRRRRRRSRNGDTRFCQVTTKGGTLSNTD